MLSIILGNNIDTIVWIKYLRNKKAENIIVIDYEYFGEPKKYNEAMYMSNSDALKYLSEYDKLSFYKSMYAYPGMV